jgi:subtilisin family serine protease
MERDGERFGAGLVDNINQGVKWAVDNGADVINMSLGVRHEGGGLPHAEVIRYALEKGVTVVAASGNDGQNALYYPGALPGVITVGAMSREGGVAGFSTYNRRVQLIAPGEDVYSCYRGVGYAFASGTSHAAPFVAGAVALLKSFVRGLTDGQAKYLLKHTADRLDQRFQHPKAGYGRLNIIDALRLARAKTA